MARPPLAHAGGAAAVVDAVGSTGTAELSLAIVRPGGTVVRVGVGRARRSQATLTYFKEVTVVGSNGYRRQDLDTALAMLAGGGIAWREWLTHPFPSPIGAAPSASPPGPSAMGRSRSPSPPPAASRGRRLTLS